MDHIPQIYFLPIRCRRRNPPLLPPASWISCFLFSTWHAHVHLAKVIGYGMQQFRERLLFDEMPKRTLEKHFSCWLYFIVANMFVCVYSAVAAGLSFTSSSAAGFELPLAMVDLVAVGFLFTSNAAAMAIDVAARKGITHFGWDKICNIADKFCGHVTAAIVLSSLATVAAVLLLVMSIVTIHRKSQY